jgi:predicted enzyme related to lactoylglutathione lyase
MFMRCVVVACGVGSFGPHPSSGEDLAMINAVHMLLYSTDPEADRAFLRDVLGYPYVEHPESGSGWLIFKLPPAEIGVHPTDGEPSHEMYLMCDDIEATVADLEGKGVELVRPVQEAGFGLVTAIRLPSGAELGLYEPHHPTAYDL